MDVLINMCDIYIILELSEADENVGRVVSSTLRWGQGTVDISNEPPLIRQLLGEVKEAYQGSLDLGGEVFDGSLIIGERGVSVIRGRLSSCRNEQDIKGALDLASKLLNTLMTIYGALTSRVNIYRLFERSTIEASTIPQESSIKA